MIYITNYLLKFELKNIHESNVRVLNYYRTCYFKSTVPENCSNKQMEELKKNKSLTTKSEHPNNVKKYPEEPTTCCMSGCPNCVWLDYAEKLTEYFKDGGEKALKEINEKVTDPNIKAYLLHELRLKIKK